MSGAEGEASTDGIREEKVTQAVQFLADSRVAAAPLERSVGFLLRKGVSAAEIREALKKSSKTITPEAENLLKNPESAAQSAPATAAPAAGAIVPAQSAVGQPPVVYYAQAPGTTVQQQQPRSTWKEAILWAGAISGLVLAARELLKKYVVPIYFPEEAEGKRLRDVQTEVHELGANMQKLQDAVAQGAKSQEEVQSLSETLKLLAMQIKEMNTHNVAQKRAVESLEVQMKSFVQSTRNSAATPATDTSATVIPPRISAPAFAPESAVEDEFFSMKPTSIDAFANRVPSSSDNKQRDIQQAMADKVKNLPVQANNASTKSSASTSAPTAPANQAASSSKPSKQKKKEIEPVGS